MENHPDSLPDDSPDTATDERSGIQERFKHAILGMQKPTPQSVRRALKPVTNDEKRARMLIVHQLVKLGMSVEQMADFLPTWEIQLGRSTLYEYLATLGTPRWYSPSEGQQSHHDYYTFRFFIRIAQDAAAGGFRTHHLAKGTAPFDGARFRPDFSWQASRFLFYHENQLSDLTETRWSVKFRNYARLRHLMGRPFRALMMIDQRGDLAYARRHARKVLEREPPHFRDLLLFINLGDLKGSRNLALDPVWKNAWGEKRSLLQWLRRPGQQPAVTCQR